MYDCCLNFSFYAAWATLLSWISFHMDIGISVYLVAGASHLNNLELPLELLVYSFMVYDI